MCYVYQLLHITFRYGINTTDKLCQGHTLNCTHYYSDVIIGTVASQITSLTIVYSSVYSGTDQRKHQISASLAFVRGIHQLLVNSPHKRRVTRKMFPFDDVSMTSLRMAYTARLCMTLLWVSFPIIRALPSGIIFIWYGKYTVTITIHC